MSTPHRHGQTSHSNHGSNTLNHPDPLRSHPLSGATAFNPVARADAEPSLRQQFNAGAWRPSDGAPAPGHQSTTTSGAPVVFRSAEPQKSFADRAKDQGFRRP
ncbi:hypothetical protein JCM10207_008113 [Rhodosporidiobolus poonsookiae]